MTNSQDGWTEADSQLYQDIATVAVPARIEQIAALLTLLPFKQSESFKIMDIGCGEGVLSYALLDCFPGAELIALDGSSAMRRQAQRRLKRFGERVTVAPFDLFSADWYPRLDDVDCVVSSLCLHHLFGETKKPLFAEIACRTSVRGALLIADLVEPVRPEARKLFAATWDTLAKTQSIDTKTPHLFEQFIQMEWNYYRFDDPIDRPSPLFDQLLWMKEVGFEVVDCFWMQAGHAIYGGYKSFPHTGTGNLSFGVALGIAEKALRR